MLLGRGLGGPKPKAWAKAEAQKLKAFFARQEERQRSGGGAAELEWAYSTDGEDTHHARVPVGGLVKHVTLGLFGTVLQKGSGAEPGDGTCEVYWAQNGQECAADVAGAQQLLRGGTGDLEIRLNNGSTA